MADKNGKTFVEPSPVPRVLVVVASKHGSTIDIGRTISDGLREAGCAVDFRASDSVAGFGGYDAVVLGSAVYLGHWLPAAEEFASDQAEHLKLVDVWLFESGPVGETASPNGSTEEGAQIAQMVGARAIKAFAGRLDRRELNLGERALVRLTKQTYGDFRDGVAITSWARSIAAELRAIPNATAHPNTSKQLHKEEQS